MVDDDAHRNDTARDQREQRRQLLALMRPPKPIAEMSDEERNAFADEMYERMLAGCERIVRDGDDK
jgi:hypothetical protein